MLVFLIPIFFLVIFILNEMFRRLDNRIEGSDGGYTSLIHGSLRKKNEPIFDVLGDIDELNSHLGFARSHFLKNIMDIDRIKTIQQNLMTISSMLAGATIENFDNNIECTVLRMEHWIIQDSIRVTSFVIPSHYLHICRTVCRRAERTAVSVGKKLVIKFLNRLSKYLYSLSLKNEESLSH
jgi:cob(I)alamin adenosyltransferase